MLSKCLHQNRIVKIVEIQIFRNFLIYLILKNMRSFLQGAFQHYIKQLFIIVTWSAGFEHHRLLIIVELQIRPQLMQLFQIIYSIRRFCRFKIILLQNVQQSTVRLILFKYYLPHHGFPHLSIYQNLFMKEKSLILSLLSLHYSIYYEKFSLFFL